MHCIIIKRMREYSVARGENSAISKILKWPFLILHSCVVCLADALNCNYVCSIKLFWDSTKMGNQKYLGHLRKIPLVKKVPKDLKFWNRTKGRTLRGATFKKHPVWRENMMRKEEKYEEISPWYVMYDVLETPSNTIAEIWWVTRRNMMRKK